MNKGFLLCEKIQDPVTWQPHHNINFQLLVFNQYYIYNNTKLVY